MSDHGPQKQPASVGRIEAQRKQAERELGPFGCWCTDFARHLTGDGCEICNPMPDLYGDEDEDEDQPTTKGRRGE